MIKIQIDQWKIESWLKEEDKKDRVSWLCQDAKFKQKIEAFIKYKENTKENSYVSCPDFLGFYNDANVLPYLPEWIINDSYNKYWEFHTPLHFVKPEDENKSVSTMGLTDLIKLNQIRLPDNLLLQIREVKVLENACTDTLNDELKNGFRIIAICIQHGQRRPDYVLGKI